jgi:uncharacterized membrane protein
MYLAIKLLHEAAVVLFLGNIITGLFWHAHAARSRDPKLMAHAMDGIIRSDRWFTIPAAVAIVATGIATAVLGGMPILGTPWIAWTVALFAASSVVFAAWIGPLQRELLVRAQAATFDFPTYRRRALHWEAWGAIALIAPLAGMAIMVLKPAL